MSDAYEVVIGLEVHAQLRTRSKMFCGCSTAFGAPPNTQTCPVCQGMPGTLPVINRRAVEFGIKTALSSQVDFNRAGVPLMEIVSMPDMRTPEEAAAYLKSLRAIVVYLDVCDGNMEEGSLRCDANISLRRP